MPVPTPNAVSLSLSVQTYDIDFAGIVSNIVYIRWLEDLRLAMLGAYLPLEDELARGRTPVLISTTIEYVRAVRLFEKPVGRMWLGTVGRVRWTLHAEITVQGRVAARATQACVSVSTATFRPLPAPPALRRLSEVS